MAQNCVQCWASSVHNSESFGSVPENQLLINQCKLLMDLGEICIYVDT